MSFWIRPASYDTNPDLADIGPFPDEEQANLAAAILASAASKVVHVYSGDDGFPIATYPIPNSSRKDQP